MNNKHDLCARAYLEYYRHHFKKYAWSCDYADQLLAESYSKCYDFVREVVDLCKTADEIVYVAAGILEDLIHVYPTDIAKDLHYALAESENMRKAIDCILSSQNAAARKELQGLFKAIKVLNAIKNFP